MIEAALAVDERKERDGQEGYAQEALGVPGAKNSVLGEMSKNEVVEGGDSEDLEMAIGFAKVGMGEDLEERDEREDCDDEREEEDIDALVSENMVSLILLLVSGSRTTAIYTRWWRQWCRVVVMLMQLNDRVCSRRTFDKDNDSLMNMTQQVAAVTPSSRCLIK